MTAARKQDVNALAVAIGEDYQELDARVTSAQTAATNANTKADSANTKADTAVSTANTALTKANAAAVEEAADFVSAYNGAKV